MRYGRERWILNWIDGAQLDTLKSFGGEIGKMISGLIRSIKTSKSQDPRAMTYEL